MKDSLQIRTVLAVLLLCIGAVTTLSATPSQQADSTKTEQAPSAAFFGVLKTRVETNLDEGSSRFSVRNTRVGVKGSLNPSWKYQLQTELSSNGTFNVLDLYTTLQICPGLSLTVGQAGLPIYNSYTVSPGSLMFANRPFLGKYNTGSREIGATAKYETTCFDLPISVEAGAYNGGKINNPQWTQNPSYAARITLGTNKGLRFSAKGYRYPLSEMEDYRILGADLRYEAKNWKIETEWMSKYNYADQRELSTYYVQGGYAIPCQLGSLFDHLIPAARWDGMGYDVWNDGFQVNRLTLGIGLGLTKKYFSSILRLDYELYNIPEEDRLTAYFPGEDFKDKLTLEFLLIF